MLPCNKRLFGQGQGEGKGQHYVALNRVIVVRTGNSYSNFNSYKAGSKYTSDNRLDGVFRAVGLRARRMVSKLDKQLNISTGFKSTTKGIQDQIDIMNARFNTKHKMRVFLADCERLFAKFSKQFQKVMQFMIHNRFGRLFLSIGFFYALFTGFLPRLFFWFLQLNLLFMFVVLPLARLIRGKPPLQFQQQQSSYNPNAKQRQYSYAQNQYQQQRYQQQQQQQYYQKQRQSMQSQKSGGAGDVVIDAQWKSVDEDKMQ